MIDDAPPSVSEGCALPKGFGRIIRDLSGNIVRVELPIDEEAGHTSKQELGIDAPVVTTESELRIWAHCPETRREAESGGMGISVVQGQFSICMGPCSTYGQVSPRGTRAVLFPLEFSLERWIDGSPMVP